jgi:propanediol dehydratase small subunit
MSRPPLAVEDYPLAEKHPELVEGPRGRKLADVTLDEVLLGAVTMEDLRITPGALLRQAEIARAAGRPTLAQNFERAAEMTAVPQAVIMEIYDLLRPGRARDKSALVAAGARLRKEFGGDRLASFIEEAAEVYEQRGLFRARY